MAALIQRKGWLQSGDRFPSDAPSLHSGHASGQALALAVTGLAAALIRRRQVVDSMLYLVYNTTALVLQEIRVWW
jgi:hypothetical protein